MLKLTEAVEREGEGDMVAVAEWGRLDSVLTGVDRIGRGVVERALSRAVMLSSIQHPFKVER